LDPGIDLLVRHASIGQAHGFGFLSGVTLAHVLDLSGFFLTDYPCKTTSRRRLPTRSLK